MNGLAVIIPSKTLANLMFCIERVLTHERRARIIVVDDGLQFDNAEIENYVRSHATIVKGIQPFVFARNINIGIQAAGNDDDVVLLNDDALLDTPCGFTRLQQLSVDHSEFGVIAPATNITGQPLQKNMGVGLRQVPHIAFVCVLIPRRTIDTVGMLDERYVLDYGCEDRDYCEAVNRAGLKVGVYDDCFVDHSKLQSSFRGDPSAGRSFAKNFELFKQKWGYA